MAYAKNKTGHRIYALDVLRFLAAFAVVMYHYTYRKLPITGHEDAFAAIDVVTKFGFLGVNLFFMISGFVILQSALSRNPTGFAISRATRLYPTYWVCVTLTTAVLILFSNGLEDLSLFKYLANMTMLNDYIGVGNIDSVYWTLQAEIKFYACIFVLMLLGWVRNYKVWMSVWLAATVSYFFIQQPYFMGWLISPFYSCYFIAGAAFYLAMINGFKLFHIAILLITLLLALAGSHKQVESYIRSPDELDKIITNGILLLSYLLFYLLSTNKLNFNKSLLITYLGGITYPLYLIHAKAGKVIFDQISYYLSPYIALFLIICFVLLISLVLHIYVEKKLSNFFKLTLEALVLSSSNWAKRLKLVLKIR